MGKLIPLFRTDSPPQWGAFHGAFPEQRTPLSFDLAPLAQEHVRLLRVVNSYINNSITYQQEDGDHWHVFDCWEQELHDILQNTLYWRGVPGKLTCLEGKKGDCEDFVFTKRKALANIFGYGALCPVICKPEGMQSHMILCISDSHTTWVLDNNRNSVVSLTKTYRPRLVYHSGDWKTCHVGD